MLDVVSFFIYYNEIMFTKHFFKILFIFMGMIILGIVGALLISYFDGGKSELNSILPVAK